MDEKNHDSAANSVFFLDPRMKHASKLTTNIHRKITYSEMII